MPIHGARKQSKQMSPRPPKPKGIHKKKRMQITKCCRAVLCKPREEHAIATNFDPYLFNPDQLLDYRRREGGQKPINLEASGSSTWDT